jgi:class 3 adenylate cyclase
MVPFGAAKIPGADVREMPPGPHLLFDEALGSAIVEFVRYKPVPATTERVLSTVLFTDIVGSTEQLSATGDAHWRHQLDAHDKVVDWLLEKYGGHRVKHTGDGIFALFDGPTKAARYALDLVPALATRGIQIRAGVHIGECERRGEEWSGMAVHVGARIGRWPDLAKCSQVAQCAIYQRARACASNTSVPIASRDSPKTPRSSGSLHQRAT